MLVLCCLFLENNFNSSLCFILFFPSGLAYELPGLLRLAPPSGRFELNFDY